MDMNDVGNKCSDILKVCEQAALLKNAPLQIIKKKGVSPELMMKELCELSEEFKQIVNSIL